MSNRIGPKGKQALAYISDNPLCCKFEVASRVARYGRRGARQSYGVIDRLIGKGLVANIFGEGLPGNRYHLRVTDKGQATLEAIQA